MGIAIVPNVQYELLARRQTASCFNAFAVSAFSSSLLSSIRVTYRPPQGLETRYLVRVDHKIDHKRGREYNVKGKKLRNTAAELNDNFTTIPNAILTLT